MTFFGACQEKMVCPAYQSYFILDKEVTKRKFSLFGEDSLPKTDLWQVDKGKYGIADDLPYPKKIEAHKTVSMESIYLKKEDVFEDVERPYAEMDTALFPTDTVPRESSQIERRGYVDIDQMIYLYHFGDQFSRPKPEPETEEQLIEESAFDEAPVEKKEKKGFWPFRKKSKEDSEEEDQVDSGEQEQE